MQKLSLKRKRRLGRMSRAKASHDAERDRYPVRATLACVARRLAPMMAGSSSFFFSDAFPEAVHDVRPMRYGNV